MIKPDNTTRKRLMADTDAVLCEVCSQPIGARIQRGADKSTRGWCRLHARNLPPVPAQTARHLEPRVDNPKPKET